MAAVPEIPSISVVMPVHNGGSYLRHAVDSILGQTFPDFELIVVDDRSTDGAVEALGRIGDPRMRIVANAGAGLVAALNTGLVAARGALIARMDADDIALPERFARQFEYLGAHPEIAVLGTAVILIDGVGNEGQTVVYPTAPAAIRALPPHVHFMAHPTVMMRADIVRELGGYRALFAVAEDFDLWLRVGDRHDVANLAEPLLKYRRHAKQHSRVHRATSRRNVALIAFLTHERRAGRGDADYLRPTVAASCLAAVEHLATMAPGARPLKLKMVLGLLEGASEDPGSDRSVDALAKTLLRQTARALDVRAVWRVVRARRTIARMRSGRL